MNRLVLPPVPCARAVLYRWPPVTRPEPHVLLFRRLHGTDPVTGRVDKEEAARVRREVFEELGLEDGEETKD